MKILEIVHDFPPQRACAVELYSFRLSRAIEQLGHEVTLLHPFVDPELPTGTLQKSEFGGLATVRASRPRPLSPLTMIASEPVSEEMRRFLRQGHFDQVHVQHLAGFSVGLLDTIHEIGIPIAVNLCDMYYTCPRSDRIKRDGSDCEESPVPVDTCVPCVWGRIPHDLQVAAEYHGLIAFRRQSWRNALARAALLHCPSEFVRQHYLAQGFDDPPPIVVRSGIDPFRIEARVASPDDRVRIALLQTSPDAGERLDFVRAVEICHASPMRARVEKKLEFLVYEEPWPEQGPDAIPLSGEARRHITRKGPFLADARARIFSEIDVALIPSAREIDPQSVYEALYAGVPVIATRRAGLPEIIREGENGRLYKRGNPHELAQTLLEFANPPDRIRRLDPAVESIPSIEDNARVLLALFQQPPRAQKATAAASTRGMSSCTSPWHVSASTTS